jgi:uncharacterized membrane protein YdjX (TVP38/TMEM64 family)
VTDYLVAFAVIFGVNLLPAFGPPTWAALVFFKLNSDLAAVPLVLGGAVSAASGRLVLANVSRRLRGRFSRRRLESLAAAEEALAGDRRKELGGLLLFALSPVPSAQLFVAAGLLEVRLVPLTLAFFAGRLVSYSIYVSGASLAKHSIEHTLTAAFSSWWGITLQVVMLAGVVALVRVDWTRVLARPAAGMRSRG